MSNITKPVELATIFISGDPSVGIPDTHFDVQMYFDPNCIAEEDIKPTLEDIRNRIVQLYYVICGEQSKVMFDFELASMNEEA